MKQNKDSPKKSALSVIILCGCTGIAAETREYFYAKGILVHELLVNEAEGAIELASDGFSFEKGPDSSFRIKECKGLPGGWVLLLEEDEFLEERALAMLVERLSRLQRLEHLVGVTRYLPEGKIEEFSWVTTREVFRSPTPSMKAYHILETRLIPKERLQKGQIRIAREGDVPFRIDFQAAVDQKARDSRPFVPLSISRRPPRGEAKVWEPPEDRDIFLRGHSKFYDDKEFVDEFGWPRTMYMMIRTDHVPVVLKGLKEGTTSISIVMHTLNYLLRLGKFDLAAGFLPHIPSHWEEIDPVIAQMKAMILFFSGNAEKARDAFLKASKLHRDDPVVLENMGKFFLLLGEREHAEHFFTRSLEGRKDEDSAAHLKTFIETLRENPSRRPTLSVCILCLDEERLLPRALESVSSLADEIIVVDTGSHDRSVEIAKSFGARVLRHPWTDDFSEVRNYALGHVRSDYVLMLDADEYLFSLNLVDFQVMKQLLPIGSPCAFALSIGHLKVETDWINVLIGGGNFVEETQAIRIFPRDSRLLYSGRVEESLNQALSGLSIPVIALDPDQMRIHHDVNDRERRVARKLSAYEKETDCDLARAAAAVRDFSYIQDREGTTRWLRRLFDLGMKEGSPLITGAGIRLAGMLEGRSEEEAREILKDLLKRFPDDRRLVLAWCSHLCRRGRLQELSGLDFSPSGHQDPSSETDDPAYWSYRALASFERGDIDTAAGILEGLLSRDPGDLMAHAARYYMLCKGGELAYAAEVLQHIRHIISGETPGPIGSGLELLNAVYELCGLLERWGRQDERCLLLHGTLLMEETLEVRR